MKELTGAFTAPSNHNLLGVVRTTRCSFFFRLGAQQLPYLHALIARCCCNNVFTPPNIRCPAQIPDAIGIGHRYRLRPVMRRERQDMYPATRGGLVQAPEVNAAVRHAHNKCHAFMRRGVPCETLGRDLPVASPCTFRLKFVGRLPLAQIHHIRCLM
eukprot:scaffold182240_cov33-Tisochrysis_lutea.AAC.2